MRFRATLALHGKTATGIAVPAFVVEALGSGRPAVRVTLRDHTYRTTVGRMGGEHLIPVSAAVRAAAGIAAGDELDVDVAPDDAPRTVEVPDDLAAALAEVPGAREAFDALSYTDREEHVRKITEAKKPETRTRRITAALDTLRP